MNHEQTAETIYSKPESICPSRISYYASSQLTQVSATISSTIECPRGLIGFEMGARTGVQGESKPLIYCDTWQAQMEMGFPLKRSLLSSPAPLPRLPSNLSPGRGPSSTLSTPESYLSSTIKIKF